MENQSISIAIPHLTGGGAEKITALLAKELHAQGKLSRVYVGEPQDTKLPANLPFVNLNSLRALGAAPRMLRRLSGDPCSTILLTLGYVNFAPLVRLRSLKRRIVVRIGNTASPELRTLSLAQRVRYLGSLSLALRVADRIIVQCKAMGDDLTSHFPKVADKIQVIYNFIEDDIWKFRATEDPPIVGRYLFCAASYKPQKDHEVLLAAFAKSSRGTGTKLIVAGVKEDDVQYTRLMDQYGLTDENVVRLGFRRDVYNWMAHADLCVLTSKYEGFSNFLLEAAALGKRIVATDCPGGNRELFERYPNLISAPVGDVEQLALAFTSERCDLDPRRVQGYLRDFHQPHVVAQYSAALSEHA